MRSQLVDSSDGVLDVGPQLGQLSGVLGAKLRQFDDLLAQAGLGVQRQSEPSSRWPLPRRSGRRWGGWGCLRGLSTLTAFGLAVEAGDWHRFTGATIDSSPGLVPSEASSGRRWVQGPITKTGNSHVRPLLVEASWHHRRRYRPGYELTRRQASQPPATSETGPSVVTSGGSNSTPVTIGPPLPPWPSPANWPDGAGASPPWTSRPDPTAHQAAAGRPALDRQREEDLRHSSEQSRPQPTGPRPTRDPRKTPDAQQVMRYPTCAHISLTARRPTRLTTRGCPPALTPTRPGLAPSHPVGIRMPA